MIKIKQLANTLLESDNQKENQEEKGQRAILHALSNNNEL